MTYLLVTCIVSRLRKLKTHPDSQQHLWSIEFSYFNEKKLANCGCITRIVAELQMLFALNRVYFVAEKDALKTIKIFSIKPAEYTLRINDILSCLGRGEFLIESLKKLNAVIKDVIELSGHLYTYKYPVES